MSSKFMSKVRRSRIYASVQSLKPSTLVVFTLMLLPVVAHAQGTMDFSGAQTLMGTFNSRLAYVAISRASEDARVYTNNAETLGERLASDITKTAAHDLALYTPGAPSMPGPEVGSRSTAPSRIPLPALPEIEVEGMGIGR